MKKKIKIIQYGLFSLLGVGLLFYVFKSQSVSNIFLLISTSNVYLLTLASIIFFITHIFRALRWQILIETANKKPSVGTLYNAIISSLLVNIFITRFGEVYRCMVVSKTNNIAVSTLLGTVITERIIDLLSLMVVTIIVVICNFQISTQYISEHILPILANSLITITAILGIICVITVCVYYYIYTYKRPVLIKIKNFFKGLSRGILSITKIKRKLSFWASTIIVWFLYWLFTHLVTLSFPATSQLDAASSLLILVLSGVAMSLPIQSGIGAFHILISNVLILYGIKADNALAYATLAHGLPLITVVILGSIALISIYLKLKKDKKHAKLRYNTE